MSFRVGFKYGGLALPLATVTYTLWDSTIALQHGGAIQSMGFARFLLDLVCDHDGTLTWYKSSDHGTNWLQLGTQAVVGASNTSTIVDFLIEEYPDWKLTFTAGASTMTVFNASMAATSQRAQG